MNDMLSIQAGPRALAQIRRHGLRAADIAVIPGAAGGPKGLILQKLDQWLFGEWLPTAPRERLLIGASIGAWRMAAACAPDPVDAFARLGDLYCEQRYPHKPTAAMVTEVCKRIIAGVIDGGAARILDHPQHRLAILAARGSRLLRAPQTRNSAMLGFGAAILSNCISRAGLAPHLERVILGDVRAQAPWLRERFDAFETHFAALRPDNLESALLASGTLPFIMDPVRELPHAPVGTYWDGGLIDYHLAFPYARIGSADEEQLVLYPHFGEQVVPGWFDKQLPWRRAHRGRNRRWLDNVILVAPSRAFLERLPRRKLPDRNDFMHYGLAHEQRIRAWHQAIGEGERLRDALADFVARPDPGQVRPIRAD